MGWDGEDRRDQSLSMQILTKISELHSDHRILSSSVDQVKKDVHEVKDTVIKNSGRISRLELWKAGIIGALGVVLALLGWIMPHVIKTFF